MFAPFLEDDVGLHDLGGVRQLPTDSCVQLHPVLSSSLPGSTWPEADPERLGREDGALDFSHSGPGFILMWQHPLSLPRQYQAHVSPELTDGGYLKADRPHFGGVSGHQVQSGVMQTEPYLELLLLLTTWKGCPPLPQCFCTLVSAPLPAPGGDRYLSAPLTAPPEGRPGGIQSDLGSGSIKQAVYLSESVK